MCQCASRIVYCWCQSILVHTSTAAHRTTWKHPYGAPGSQHKKPWLASICADAFTQNIQQLLDMTAFMQCLRVYAHLINTRNMGTYFFDARHLAVVHCQARNLPAHNLPAASTPRLFLKAFALPVHATIPGSLPVCNEGNLLALHQALDDSGAYNKLGKSHMQCHIQSVAHNTTARYNSSCCHGCY
jgi:hypothetical protein